MSQLVPVKHDHTRRTNRRVVRQRDHQAMEERRMRAADLLERGMIPAEIARRVGVAHRSFLNGVRRGGRVVERRYAARDPPAASRSWALSNSPRSRTRWSTARQPTDT